MYGMKYSVGFSNSKKSSFSPRKRRTVRTLGKSVSGLGFNTYKNVKKYSSRHIGSTKSSRKDKKGGKNPEFKKRIRKVLYIIFGVGFFIGCVGLIVLGAYLKKIGDALPSPDQLVERSSDQSTQILDRNGNLLYTVYGDENREFVPLDKIPEHTKKALLAAEDAEFYQHKGLDYLGIMKALLQNLKGGKVVRGGSTLTQQLVKTTLLEDILGKEAYERTLSRKIKEALITMQVEQTFTKDQILQMYMNEVFLGGVNYGFQAAANSYFGKDVSELTLAESSLIAGLIQSPSNYAPVFGAMPEMAKVRQNYVLDQLEQKQRIFGISKEDIEAARNEELTYKSTKIDIKSPHFVFYVKGLLEEEFGVDMVQRGGLKVTTSLDPTLQGIAEEEIIKGVAENKRHNVNNGAMVVMNPKNGQILAMVGSVDYWNIEDPRVDGNVNITTSMRQMGSSVKPFVYLNMMSQGYGPWLVTPDIDNISFGNYKPKNWDGKYFGLITARKALVLSRNIPTVYALQVGGIDNYLQLMQKLGVQGIESKAGYGLSLGLGSAEMRMLDLTNAYATLANSGIRHESTAILKVEDSKGKVLKEVKESEGQRVIDEKEAYAVNWMICDMNGFNDRYANKSFYIGKNKLCGKTGTTDGPKDLLAFQYNQSLVVGVWNGNNNNEVMPGGWSSTVSLDITNSFFRRVIDKYNEFNFNRPAGIMTTSVCTDTGGSPTDEVECNKEASIYIAGRAPQVDARKAVEVCTENDAIPSNLEVAKLLGLTTTKTLLTTKLENSNQVEAYRAYLSGSGSYLFDEPETKLCPIPLGPDNAPVLTIARPTAGQQVEAGKNLEIAGSVRFLDSLSSFTVKVNGSDVAGVGVPTVNADGTFVVNYTVPNTSATLNIVVTAKDSAGKSDSKSVSVTVTNIAATIQISSPSNGATVTKGSTQMKATVTGNITSAGVTFTITGTGTVTTPPKTVKATQESAGVWVATIPSSVSVGSATISASAKSSNGTDIVSNTVSVTIN